MTSIAGELENIDIKNKEEWQRLDQILERAIQRIMSLVNEQRLIGRLV
jgi:hypothetical protein